jgi:uncharacterized membrane protein
MGKLNFIFSCTLHVHLDSTPLDQGFKDAPLYLLDAGKLFYYQKNQIL